jgi:cytochrome P450
VDACVRLVDFALPFPLQVIADLIGVPREDLLQFRALHNDWQ